jgi:hypothetical protein
MKNFIRQVVLAALALGFVAAAGAWQGPAQEPPAGNVAAPLNVSGSSQSKQGTLGVGGLGVFGKAFVSPAAGYALPANLQLGVNGAMGASAYCDARGQNCVTTLGGAGGAVIEADACRVAVSPIKSEWSHVGCSDVEVMTGGGCRSHGGAYSYWDFPFVAGTDATIDWYGERHDAAYADGQMYWGCSSGSTGTYSQAYAICCAAGNDASTEESPMSGDEIMRCINPATWTWIC